jgi:hypothetical protein
MIKTMKKNYPVILAVLAFSLTSFGQKAGLKSIQKDNLKATMTFFSSDELQGRETGTPANDVAALYIKTNIMRLGLKPIPETGDYFQMIPFVSKKIVQNESYLKIIRSNGEMSYSTDSVVLFNLPSETMEFNENVVFAGYAHIDTITGYNDFRDVAIKDKIVFLMTRNPDLVKTDEGKSMIQMEVEGPKLEQVIKKEPKALFLVYDPKNKYCDPYESGISKLISSEMVSLKNDSVPSPAFQIGFLTQHTADMLLKTTGKSLRQMQDSISATCKPVSLEIPDITATIKTTIGNREFTGKNVIGVIEGSDPELKKECIVYTAHFDHVGVNEKGEIFNGADDDASGSMALIEIARAYMKLKKKPLRTIVFAWVTGEEKGLLGSRYYVDNPVIPLKNTLVDINLDMIGRSKNPSDTGTFEGFDLTVTQPGEVLVYSLNTSSQLFEMLAEAAEQTGVKVIDKGNDLQFGSSDHASFAEKGVPGLLLISGIHADLHSTRDDADKIDYDKMEKISRMAFLLGYNISNRRERIKTDNPTAD